MDPAVLIVILFCAFSVGMLLLLLLLLLPKFCPTHPIVKSRWFNYISVDVWAFRHLAFLLQRAQRWRETTSQAVGTGADSPLGGADNRLADTNNGLTEIIIDDSVFDMTPTSKTTQTGKNVRGNGSDRPMSNARGSDLLNACMAEVVTKHIANFRQLYGSVPASTLNDNNSVMSPVLLIYTLVQLACISKGDTRHEILRFLRCPTDRTCAAFRPRKYQDFIEDLVERVKASISTQDTHHSTWEHLLVWFDQESSPKMNTEFIEDMFFQHTGTRIERSSQADGCKRIQELDVWATYKFSSVSQIDKLITAAAKIPGTGVGLCSSSGSFLIGSDRQGSEQKETAAAGKKSGWFSLAGAGNIVKYNEPTARCRLQMIKNFTFKDYSVPLRGMHKLTHRETKTKYTLAVPEYAREFRCYFEKDSGECTVSANGTEGSSIMCLEFPLSTPGANPSIASLLSMRIIMPFGKKGLFDVEPQQVANTFIAWDEIVKKNYIDPVPTPCILMPMLNIAPTWSDFAHILRSCGVSKCFNNQADLGCLFEASSPPMTTWMHDIVQVVNLQMDCSGNMPEEMSPNAFIEYSRKKGTIIPVSSAFYFAIMYRLAPDSDNSTLSSDTLRKKSNGSSSSKSHSKKARHNGSRPQGYCIPIYTGCMTDPLEYAEPAQSDV